MADNAAPEVRDIRAERSAIVTNFLGASILLLLGVVGYFIDGHLRVMNTSLMDIRIDMGDIKVRNAEFGTNFDNLKSAVDNHTVKDDIRHEDVKKRLRELERTSAILGSRRKKYLPGEEI